MSDHKRVTGWICGGCEGFIEQSPWHCPGCEKPLCENCFDSYMHCTECYHASGDSPDERDIACAKAADAKYGTEFTKDVAHDLQARMLSDC